MILATHAPSLPQHAHDEDEEEAEEEEDEGYGVVADASPHAQVMRLLLRAVKGGPAARAALVDARNRNGKTGGWFDVGECAWLHGSSNAVMRACM